MPKTNKKHKKNILDDVTKKIAKILGVSKVNLIKKNDFSKFEEWDSLKHLEIITQLEKLLGNKVKRIKNLSETTNLKKILSLFKNKK